jgi:hypothetical protein
VADVDKRKVFSILISGLNGHGIGKVCGMVVRPLIFKPLMLTLLLVLMEGYQKHLQRMCNMCGSYVMTTFVSILGLLCFFFFHFNRKLLPKNLGTLLNWKVPHIYSILQIWKNVEVHGNGSDMVELANSLSQLFESLYQKQVRLFNCCP